MFVVYERLLLFDKSVKRVFCRVDRFFAIRISNCADGVDQAFYVLYARILLRFVFVFRIRQRFVVVNKRLLFFGQCFIRVARRFDTVSAFRIVHGIVDSVDQSNHRVGGFVVRSELVIRRYGVLKSLRNVFVYERLLIFVQTVKIISCFVDLAFATGRINHLADVGDERLRKVDLRNE